MDTIMGDDDNGTARVPGHWRKKPRRKWSEAERKQIIAASYTPGASLAGVARDYGINANLLWNWRRKLKQCDGAIPVRTDRPIDFLPVEIVEAERSEAVTTGGAIELNLPGGAMIRVDAAVDEQALVRVLCALRAAS
jgi:transposase